VAMLLAGGASGCSSRPVQTAASTRPAGTPVAAPGKPAAREPAQPSSGPHRPTRPIPEVIARAKPFRIGLADAARPSRDPVASGIEPASGTMPLAAHPRAADGPDVAGITRTMRSYLQAFNRHDPAALAAHWSPAGENVNLDSGETTAGREAVRAVFTALFEQDAGATIDIDVASIRPLRDDVAIVDGVSRIAFTDAPPSNSRFCAVLVREQGEWVLDSVRESNVPLPPGGMEQVRQEPARPLDALAWLVGSWEDVSAGVTASTHCFWSTNRAFLIRRHLVSVDAVPEQQPLPGDSRIPGLLPAGSAGSREITEIIGWDPHREQLRSWVFTSDGRSAEGSWSHDGDAWTVRMAGTAADDDCVTTLSRVGPDELSCRAGSDRLADVLPPACDYVRTARSAEPALLPEGR